ncbi:hypothetical protein WJX72_009193 [[Myrmecia] bisecta]|uniref:methionine--tRNA ligase n=1 Tax=[Myrmecia] bisecta TaxID=41462 RepID=A0AAW1PKN2_9CHLO
MGGAYSTIAADVLARFQRLQGKLVTFVTGQDEHGEKVNASAETRGLSAQEHCDDIAEQYKQLWRQLDISYDSFIRTTEGRHAKLVLAIVNRIQQKGDIFKANYEGWYCVGCEEYKDEGDMDADHACPTHRAPCQLRKEENYFFALSKYQAQLEELLEQHPEFIQPASRRNEVLGWVKSGLRDFSISRASTQWGIQIPWDPSQVLYVWLDALSGYLSALLPPDAEATLENVVSNGWPANVHIIGKDILRFHAVYWPAILMSAGLPLPHQVFGHGFLTKDGLKMGKSLGNILEPQQLLAAYGPDATRYYFMKQIIFGQDGDFSEERFRDIVNASLANDLGNLLNRTVNLLQKSCGGEVRFDVATAPADHPLRALIAVKAPGVASAYEAMRFSDAAEGVTAISGRGNLYINDTAPWTALKKGSDAEKEEAVAVLCSTLEAVRIVAVLLSPITPAMAQRIYEQLGYSAEDFRSLSWRDTQWGGLPVGRKLPKAKPVFARLEGDLVIDRPQEPALAKS